MGNLTSSSVPQVFRPIAVWTDILQSGGGRGSTNPNIGAGYIIPSILMIVKDLFRYLDPVLKEKTNSAGVKVNKLKYCHPLALQLYNSVLWRLVT